MVPAVTSAYCAIREIKCEAKKVTHITISTFNESEYTYYRCLGGCTQYVSYPARTSPKRLKVAYKKPR